MHLCFFDVDAAWDSLKAIKNEIGNDEIIYEDKNQ